MVEPTTATGLAIGALLCSLVPQAYLGYLGLGVVGPAAGTTFAGAQAAGLVTVGSSWATL